MHLILQYKIHIVIALVGFIAGFFVSRALHNPYSILLSRELSQYDNGRWLVSIDGDTIGEEYVNTRTALYSNYLFRRSTPSDHLLRDKTLRKLVDNYIILKAASKSGIFNNEKARNYLWLVLEEAMVEYYLDMLIAAKREKRIAMSDEEIVAFYKKNENLFKGKNIPEDRALMMIKGNLDEINEKFNDQTKFIARKMELGRMKKDKKILIHTYQQGTENLK